MTFITEDSSPQERNIFHIWQKNKNDTGINLAFGFKSENLDIKRLEAALNQIIVRHDRLRSVFFEENGRVFRRILPELKIEFQHFSSKSLRDFVQPFNLEEGPLIRCAFF